MIRKKSVHFYDNERKEVIVLRVHVKAFDLSNNALVATDMSLKAGDYISLAITEDGTLVNYGCDQHLSDVESYERLSGVWDSFSLRSPIFLNTFIVHFMENNGLTTDCVVKDRIFRPGEILKFDDAVRREIDLFHWKEKKIIERLIFFPYELTHEKAALMSYIEKYIIE